MADNKTKVTEASVGSYLSSIKDQERREDCESLAKLLQKATSQAPKMWGSSIVGFGSYHYKYDSGREGDSCLVGFSSRASDITVYLSAEFPDRAKLLPRLGKHKAKGGCVHIRRLSDIDPQVLQELAAQCATAKQRQHG
jgi:hypothetical protein